MNIWQELSKEMMRENRGDEVFLKVRIEPDALKLAYEERRAVTVHEHEVASSSSERIVGFGVLWQTNNEKWFEFGSLWVAPELRGKGIAGGIYRKRLALLPSGARGFVVTHNPKVVSLALKNGFVEATPENWHEIAPYDLVCEPCDRWTTSQEKLSCPYRAVRAQCQLLVR